MVGDSLLLVVFGHQSTINTVRPRFALTPRPPPQMDAYNVSELYAEYVEDYEATGCPLSQVADIKLFSEVWKTDFNMITLRQVRVRSIEPQDTARYCTHTPTRAWVQPTPTTTA